jgi:deoxyribose-phosphate aldolase
MSAAQIDTFATIQPTAEQGRNAGIPLDLDWTNRTQANRNALQRRAARSILRHHIEGNWEAAWLLRAVCCLDLSNFDGNDTPGSIRHLCSRAARPIGSDLSMAMNVCDIGLSAAAVCVAPTLVRDARRCLGSSRIAVAAVSSGFPTALSPLKLRLEEITCALESGATEIDAAITREHLLTSNWEKVYEDVVLIRETCGSACLKVVLVADQFPTLRDVRKASLISMMAGTDFLVISTARESPSGALEAGLAMLGAIHEYGQRTGYRVGFKVCTRQHHARDALHWLTLIKEELGREWLEPESFRIDSSNLLQDIERRLKFCARNQSAEDCECSIG